MEKKPSRASAVMGMIGGVSGIVTLATLIFYGGALAEQVKVLSVRVDAIEVRGTAVTREHITMDDERVKSLHDRLNRVEGAAIILPEELAKIRVELSALNATLQAVKERVNKL